MEILNTKEERRLTTIKNQVLCYTEEFERKKSYRKYPCRIRSVCHDVEGNIRNDVGVVRYRLLSHFERSDSIWVFHPASLYHGTQFVVIPCPSVIVPELTRNSGKCDFRVWEGLKTSSCTTLLEQDRPSKPSSGTMSGSAVVSVIDDEAMLSVLNVPSHP